MGTPRTQAPPPDSGAEGASSIAVSVIIATYRSGGGLDRVVASLDAQTMPQHQFEVILVDDGSPDDTFTRTSALAGERENYHAFRIENSGWPSRPRNVGIEAARGEYVVFMDHDDSLYPDGLRAVYAYARETDADIVSPKEMKTNDSWWQMFPAPQGNRPDVKAEHDIHALLPLIPHKFYRRTLFTEHAVRFPEGERVLWEDAYINVAAYRHARRVAVMADHPFYLWHASDTNTSHTFSPGRVDFWDRLADMMAYISQELSAPDLVEERDVLLAHQVSGRVIDRLLRLLDGGADEGDMAVPRALALAREYATPGVVAHLANKHLVQLELLLAGRPDLMVEFHRADLALSASIAAVRTDWVDEVLTIGINARMGPKAGSGPGFVVKDGRVHRVVSDEIAALVPPELLDVTTELDTCAVSVVARARGDYLTWNVPLSGDALFEKASVGEQVVWRGTGLVDLSTLANGAPVDDEVYDLRARMSFAGMVRVGRGLATKMSAAPALVHGRPAVAYANVKGELSIDLTQSKRTLAIDAWPRRAAAGPAISFSVPLDSIRTFGDEGLGVVNVGLVAHEDAPTASVGERVAALEAAGGVFAALVVPDGTGGARLDGMVRVPDGTYVLVAEREGTWFATERRLSVRDGRVQFI